MATKREPSQLRVTDKIMLATGIECSFPTIKGGKHRVDQLDLTHHYDRWKEDLHLTRDLGIRFLRYGIPYHRVSARPGRYDWSFTDDVFAELKRLKITPIVDLCHFGMPDWLGNSFQNPEFVDAFVRYARAFARRYPWVRLYTPINEIFVCAKFSALLGWWNEQEKSDRAFVRAVCNMSRASLLAMEEIVKVQPQAVFVQSESSEYTHIVCGCEETMERAEWENQVRFLALDLLYSHQVRGDVHKWLMDCGMKRDEYDWFMNQYLYTRCVLGVDYYSTNERVLKHDGSEAHVGEIFGWYLVARDYYRRYRRPMMHTETNMREEDGAVAWLWKQWQNLLRMREEGVPMLIHTCHSLTDQVGRDTGRREANGNINSLGLYALDRNLRPVGEAYRELISEFDWLPVVPNSGFLSID